MIKRTLLCVNFPNEESNLIETALNKARTNINVNQFTLEELSTPQGNMADISLLVIKLSGDSKQNKILLKKVKEQFIHFPIILATSGTLTSEEINQYNLDNVIDIRTFNPTFLLIKSITRELKSQHNKCLYHQIKSQFKNW